MPTGGILGSVRRMFETRVDRDGQAAALEPSAIPPGWAGEASGGGRRDRRFGLPRDILDRSLAQKVLHGWLQNRHQVLVPLTFRLERIEPDGLATLMRFTAVALLNASAADAAAQRSVERWLQEVGAGEAALAAFRAAVLAPSPLSALLDAVRKDGLEPYAYAAAVAAADTREPAGRLFADFIAARLALPADAVRSIDRRYRR